MISMDPASFGLPNLNTGTKFQGQILPPRTAEVGTCNAYREFESLYNHLCLLKTGFQKREDLKEADFAEDFDVKVICLTYFPYNDHLRILVMQYS